MEQSSSFVQHQPFQLSQLRSEFQLDLLPQNDGEEDARTKRRRQDCGKIKADGDELVVNRLDKFLIREPSGCEKLGDPTHLKAGSKNWPHHFHMSPAVVPHVEKVYSTVRQIYGRSVMDDLNDLNVNNAIWEKFRNVTLQAAIHLGQD